MSLACLAPSLSTAKLNCPRRIPLGYIFESNIVEILLQLFPQPAFRNSALQCLSEVALAAPPLMSMTVFQGPVGIAALVSTLEEAIPGGLCLATLPENPVEVSIVATQQHYVADDKVMASGQGGTQSSDILLCSSHSQLGCRTGARVLVAASTPCAAHRWRR